MRNVDSAFKISKVNFLSLDSKEYDVGLGIQSLTRS